MEPSAIHGSFSEIPSNTTTSCPSIFSNDPSFDRNLNTYVLSSGILINPEKCNAKCSSSSFPTSLKSKLLTIFEAAICPWLSRLKSLKFGKLFVDGSKLKTLYFNPLKVDSSIFSSGKNGTFS